jgi:hypothetical protein
LAKSVIANIRFEIAQIERLFETYRDLLEQVQYKEPDHIEIAAIASVLHSFYNGLENIFLSVAKGIDRNVPVGNRWHQDLLTNMAHAIAERPSVLTCEMSHKLGDYLAFRHFYRHSYSFILEWTELGKLVIPVAEVWKELKNELHVFLNSIEHQGNPQTDEVES